MAISLIVVMMLCCVWFPFSCCLFFSFLLSARFGLRMFLCVCPFFEFGFVDLVSLLLCCAFSFVVCFGLGLCCVLAFVYLLVFCSPMFVFSFVLCFFICLFFFKSMFRCLLFRVSS